MAASDHQLEPDAHEPALAIRRHADRCFHAVEEVVRAADGTLEGYIVEGFLIRADEVAAVRDLDSPLASPPTCGRAIHPDVDLFET